MINRRFHLGWFTTAQRPGWGANGPVTGSGEDYLPQAWQDGAFFREMAATLENACFDFILFDDHMVSSDDPNFISARLDPLMLIPSLAVGTQRIGLIATSSTQLAPPFLFARQVATADHLTGGRMGWNVVTSTEPKAAKAFGLDALPGHDARYDQADEYIDLLNRLWTAWEPDAIEADTATGRYVDPAKVHEFEFAGEYYNSLGPLNVSRSPQGKPVICQAGSSPRGREFAARHADVIMAAAFGMNSVTALKEYRDDIHDRMRRIDRDPASCKVMFIVSPIVAATSELAWQAHRASLAVSQERINWVIARFTTYTGLDWSAFDLDQPLPEIDIDAATEGMRGMVRGFLDLGAGGTRTFREMIGREGGSSLDLVGTPDEVATQMGEAMDAIGGDGFLMVARPLTRAYIDDIARRLVPALQRQGLVRTQYAHPLLRDNLLDF
jgi:FMN-dependent oxidoreductase (nitrilotriacetate monooxygenase family)